MKSIPRYMDESELGQNDQKKSQYRPILPTGVLAERTRDLSIAVLV